MEMAMLKREEILAVDDVKRERVEVPEWGGDVMLQEMSAERRVAFEAALRERGEDQDWLLLAAFSIANEDGSLMFSPADLEALGKKNFKVLARLGRKALSLSRLGAVEIEAAKENFTESQG